MSVTIKECLTTKDIREFVKIPYRVYRSQEIQYSAWVPPLDMDVKFIFNRKKNAFYKHADLKAFLSVKNGEVTGRIAAIIDRAFCDFKNEKTGFVGYFECMDDDDSASALFEVAEKWLREQGMEKVVGPINGSPNLQIGNQIDSFDQLPVVEMPYAAPYYSRFYESASYTKEVDLYSYKLLSTHNMSDKILRFVNIARERYKVSVRVITASEWNEAVRIARNIWNEAWIENWGFVPWTEDEFKHLADNLKLVCDLRVCLMAYIDNEPVSFIFPIPDINFTLHKLNGKLLPLGIFKLLRAKAQAKRVRVAAFGVLKKYRNKGIDALVLNELFTRGVDCGYEEGELSWILEENYGLRNLLENWGVDHYRTHRIYGKTLK